MPRQSAASRVPRGPQTENANNNDTVAVPMAIPEESSENGDGGQDEAMAMGMPVRSQGYDTIVLEHVAGENKVVHPPPPPSVQRTGPSATMAGRATSLEHRQGGGPEHCVGSQKGGRDEDAINNHCKSTSPRGGRFYGERRHEGFT